MLKAILIAFVFLLFFISCKKQETNETSSYSEATYKVTLTGKWKNPEFAIPGGVHFTPVIGMLHNSSTSYFTPGGKASIGVERIAEDGVSFPMLAEIDSIILLKKALSDFIIFYPSVNTAVNGSFATNSSYPLLSLTSMIAPSPDWFIGLHDFNLMPNNKWVSDTTINIYVYDAGTEDGDVFGSSNPDTSPHQNIALLTPSTGSVLANGNTVLAPMATLRLVKQ